MDTDKYLETIWEVKLSYRNQERNFIYTESVEIQHFRRLDGSEYYSFFNTRRSLPSSPAAISSRSFEYSWRQEALDHAWEHVKTLVDSLAASSEEPV
jgi:hypothetical protein